METITEFFCKKQEWADSLLWDKMHVLQEKLVEQKPGCLYLACAKMIHWVINFPMEGIILGTHRTVYLMWCIYWLSLVSVCFSLECADITHACTHVH